MKTKISTFKKNAAVVATNLQESFLIYDPVLRTAYVLNTTGRLVWNQFNPGTEQQISSAFLSKFGSESEQQLYDFFQKLQEYGLLLNIEDSQAPFADKEVAFIFPEDFTYVAPSVEAYSEEFLKAHLNDEAFATFHDDTYSDIAS